MPLQAGHTSVDAKAYNIPGFFLCIRFIIPSAGRWDFFVVFLFVEPSYTLARLTLSPQVEPTRPLPLSFVVAVTLVRCHRATCPVTSSQLHRAFDSHATSPPMTI